MMRQPKRNPIIPGTKRDRTGTLPIIREARREIARRFAGLQAGILAAFRRIPVYVANDTALLADGMADPARVRLIRYGLTPEQLAGISDQMADLLLQWLLDNHAAEIPGFWWDEFVARAHHLGTAQAAANLAGLSAAYAAGRSIATIIHSDPYIRRLAVARHKSYEHWVGQSAEIRASLAQVIGRAVADGVHPDVAAERITEALSVSLSKAQQFAQTDITDTLRQARLAEDEAAEADLGVRTGQLWTSALLPTTRHSHAERHGKVFTRDEVKEFYGKNGNRYNCHCSITSALLDADGKPILSDGLKSAMAGEVQRWKPGKRR